MPQSNDKNFKLGHYPSYGRLDCRTAGGDAGAT
jgi:hypothetical protein